MGNTEQSRPIRAPAAGLGWRAPAAPQRFDARQAWLHPTPFLDLVRDTYGDLDLESLGGTYSWTIRAANRAQFRRAGLKTLGEYIDRFQSGDPRPLPYLAHVSVHRNLPALRRFLVAPAEFGPNWVDHCAVHVGFVQLTGRKRFTVFPPGDGRYLYAWRGIQFPYQRRNSAVRIVNHTNAGLFLAEHLLGIPRGIGMAAQRLRDRLTGQTRTSP